MSSSTSGPAGTFSSHRIEALDGVFAIAMTLLVIELKLPDAHSLQSAEAVQHRRACASAA